MRTPDDVVTTVWGALFGVIVGTVCDIGLTPGASVVIGALLGGIGANEFERRQPHACALGDKRAAPREVDNAFDQATFD